MHTKIFQIIAFTLLFTNNLSAQILTESNHPIIIITTDDEEIPDEPKIEATMGIIDNGEGLTNHINDPRNHYNGNIGIETRGNSTQGFDKKTYSLETRDINGDDLSVPLLGMGKEEDWILHAMVIDKTQMRIPMSFYLSQKMGHYAANWKYVELIIDDDYRGLYILTEKIKRDDDRVDIAKLDEDDIAGDSLTGGYILRIDWLWDVDEEDLLVSEYESQAGNQMSYQWYYPKPENIQPEQKEYMTDFMNDFENAVFSPDYTNESGIRYTDYIDINSFTDFILINEFSKNSDGYKLSSYLHKDKESKGGLLTAGPIWDFDQTYGMSRVCSNDITNGWTYLQNQNDCEDLESMPLWWQAMMEDAAFTNHLKCRWESLREGPFHQDSIYLWMDENLVNIQDAIGRNFTKWDNFIGESIWIEPDPIPQSYEEEITYMKSWIEERLDWMDENMPGNCADDIFSGVEELEVSSIFDVFPNPSSGLFTIDFKERVNFNFSIKIFDVNGISVYDREVINNTGKSNFEVDLKKENRGVYFVSVQGEFGLEVLKIVL